MGPVRPAQVAGYAADVPEKGVSLAHGHLPVGLADDGEDGHVSGAENVAPRAQALRADLRADHADADGAGPRGARPAPGESVGGVYGSSRGNHVRRERWGGAAPNDQNAHAGPCGRTTGRHVRAPLKYSHSRGCIDDRNNDLGTPIHIPA